VIQKGTHHAHYYQYRTDTDLRQKELLSIQLNYLVGILTEDNDDDDSYTLCKEVSS